MLVVASNPFRTPSFLALFDQWNKILVEKEHQEIEDFKGSEPVLKDWHGTNWSTICPEKAQALKKYYEIASELLKVYAFKNETHRLVWELHCEGLSVRKIAAALKIRKLTRNPVHEIIVKIQRDSGLKNG